MRATLRAGTTSMLSAAPASRGCCAACRAPERCPGIRPSLADLGVHFDVWFSEESLHRWGAVPAVMRQLEDGGHSSCEKDGALFFQAPEGAVDDKDRVVRRATAA